MNLHTKKKFALQVGKLIKTAREKKLLSQEELAFRCEIDRSYLGHIENGRHAPSIYLVWLIAHKLDVNVSHLIPPATWK